MTIRKRKRVWKVAAYIRLSREDGSQGREPESIINQRKIILEFLEEYFSPEEYCLAGVYEDGGKTGTTQETRPEFGRMCRDIAKGSINCVVVKTLSRAFRNYADQGRFLEEFLPSFGCRFISIGNPFVDTTANPDCTQSLEIPINGLMNDRYAARTSEDVKRTFQTKRKKGEFIGAFAPYGYKKSPENKNALAEDEEAAAVVREIFGSFLGGMSKSGIARDLNDRGIPCPSVYKRKNLGMNYQNPRCRPGEMPLWSLRTVDEILKNQMYCGDMVQGRSRVTSYKVHVQERVPPEEWIIVENTHVPVIPRETFQRTQELLKRTARTARGQKEPYLFSGFLFCAQCQRAMVRSQVKGRVYYYCSTYKNGSRTACTKHTIRHGELEKAVFAAIKLELYRSVSEALPKAPDWGKERNHGTEKALREGKRRLEKIRRYRRSVYEDWKDGMVTKEEYYDMREEYQSQEQSLKEWLACLEDRQEEREAAPKEPENSLWGMEMTELTRELLAVLVSSVRVLEGGGITVAFSFRAPGSSGSE